MNARLLALRHTALASPLLVAGVALLSYVAIAYAWLQPEQDVRRFIVMGRLFLEKSTASPLISRELTQDCPEPIGYDGQFAYFLALDFRNARAYMDMPGYRYARILYPLTARLLAAGDPT